MQAEAAWLANARGQAVPTLPAVAQRSQAATCACLAALVQPPPRSTHLQSRRQVGTSAAAARMESQRRSASAAATAAATAGGRLRLLLPREGNDSICGRIKRKP